MSKATDKQAERDDAISRLRAAFTECSQYVNHRGESRPRVHYNITHVSASGMQRRIRFYVISPDAGGADDLNDITYLISRATGWPMDDRGVKVDGCGMDMVFHTLDVVARTIKLDGLASGNDFDSRSI